MLSILITHKITTIITIINKRVWEETLGGHGYVHGVDCSNGFMGGYLSPSSLSSVH